MSPHIYRGDLAFIAHFYGQQSFVILTSYTLFHGQFSLFKPESLCKVRHTVNAFIAINLLTIFIGEDRTADRHAISRYTVKLCINFAQQCASGSKITAEGFFQQHFAGCIKQYKCSGGIGESS